MAIKVADALGLEPVLVIASIHAERARNDQERTVWKNLFEKLGGIAASVALAALLVPLSPAPAQASDAKGDTSVYYVKSRRRHRQHPFISLLEQFCRIPA